MAGPFFLPPPLAEFERPGAVTYNSNGERSEESEIRQGVADRQEWVHNSNPLNLKPSPVGQGRKVQQAQSPVQPSQQQPFDFNLDFPVEQLIASGILNDIDLNVGARLVDQLFGPNSVPEVQDNVIAIGETAQQYPNPGLKKFELDAGLSDGVANYEEAKNLDGPLLATDKPCELPKIEAGEQIKEESLQSEKDPLSANYVEDGVEYPEAVVPQTAKVKTKPNVGRKRQNRNKAPRQNSAAARNDPDNYTHPMPGQMHWSIDNLPNILYQLWPDKNQKKGPRPAATKLSPFPGEAALTVFDILPDQISSNVEEFRLEAWQRLDPRIELADLVARMHPRCRPKTNALQQRTVRFRKVFKMVSWGSGNKRTPHLERAILDEMEANGIDPNANSTRGLTPGLIDPSRGEAGGRIPVPSQYKDKRDNAPPPPRSYINAGLWVPTTVIEAWRNRLFPYEIAVAIQYQATNAGSFVAPMTTLPDIPAPPYHNPNRGILSGPSAAYSSSGVDTHGTGEKQEDKGGKTKKADEAENSQGVQKNKDHEEARYEGDSGGDGNDSNDIESYIPNEGEESSDSSSEESQSSQASQGTQDTEAEGDLWAEFLNFSSIGGDDCENAKVAEPIYRARSNEDFNYEDVYSAFHTLEYWDRVYSQKPFGNFGRQATVVPKSPPAIPSLPVVPQPSQPAMPAPTMHWQGSRAQNVVQRLHYDQVQNYYHVWADHIGGDIDSTRRAYNNYGGLYVYERAQQSLRYDPHLDTKAGCTWEYDYEEPRIARTGYTRPSASTQPSAITASTSQSKRKRDDDDDDDAGIGAQESASNSGPDFKRRRREDD